jgi:hypothetical protein
VLSGKLPRLIVNERGIEADPAIKKIKIKRGKKKKQYKRGLNRKRKRKKRSNGQV